MLTQPRLLVGPEHVPVLIIGMAVQTGLGVERTVICNRELVHGIVVDARHGLSIPFRDGSCQTTVGQSHEDTVEPYLVGIDSLVPVHLVHHRAGLVLQLLHQRLHGDEVFLFGQLLVHACHEMTCADIVQVIVQDVVSANLTLLVNHRVGVELAVVKDVLTAVAQVGVEHALQLDAHHVAPFRTCGEIQQVRLRIALHLRACHPFRVVLVGHFGERQSAVHIEFVEGNVAGLAGDGVTLLHTVEPTVPHGDIVDKRVLFQSDDLYTVARLLAGDILHQYIAHRGIVATTANLVVLIVQVDFQHTLAALAHRDILHEDILDDAASARVGLDAQHTVQIGRVHHAVVGKDILRAAADLRTDNHAAVSVLHLTVADDDIL